LNSSAENGWLARLTINRKKNLFRWQRKLLQCVHLKE